MQYHISHTRSHQDFFCKNMGPQKLSESHRHFVGDTNVCPGGGGGWRIWRGNTTSQHRRKTLSKQGEGANAQSKWRGKEMSTSIVAPLPSVSFTSSAAVDLRRSRTNCRRGFSSSTVSLPRHRPFSVRGFDYSADFSILCCWFFVLRFLKSIYSLLAIHEFEKCRMWVKF